jgi:hypothetical protein
VTHPLRDSSGVVVAEFSVETVRALLEAGNRMAALLEDFQVGTYDGALAQEIIGQWEAALLDIGRAVR